MAAPASGTPTNHSVPTEEFSKTLKDAFGRPLRTRGVLLKKGGSRTSTTGRASFSAGRRNWQHRFFSFDVDRGELRYYEDATMANQKGLVQLTPETTIGLSTPLLKGKHARNFAEDELHYFELTSCRDDRGILRDGPFQIRAQTAQELEEWTTSLQFSLEVLRAALSDQASAPSTDSKNANSAVLAELAQTLKERGRPRPPPPPPPPGSLPKNTQHFVVPPPPTVPPPPSPPQTV